MPNALGNLPMLFSATTKKIIPKYGRWNIKSAILWDVNIWYRSGCCRAVANKVKMTDAYELQQDMHRTLWQTQEIEFKSRFWIKKENNPSSTYELLLWNNGMGLQWTEHTETDEIRIIKSPWIWALIKSFGKNHSKFFSLKNMVFNKWKNI